MQKLPYQIRKEEERKKKKGKKFASFREHLKSEWTNRPRVALKVLTNSIKKLSREFKVKNFSTQTYTHRIKIKTKKERNRMRYRY